MVTAETPAMTVTAPPEVKQKIDAEYATSLNQCAQSVLVDDPSAAGTYMLHFRIDTDGSATSTKVEGPAARVRECVQTLVKQWRFPAQTDSKGKPRTAYFKLPLRFERVTRAKPIAGDGMMKKINSTYMKDVQACHIEAAKRDPEVQGQLAIRLEVKEDGTIGKHDASGISNDVLLNCVRGKVAAWQLPPPTLDGKPTSHTFEIKLQLGKVKVETKKIRR